MPPVHDYVIDNSTGANVRQDINNALAAIVSNNSSSSQPTTRYAYMWWADTTTGILKIRNSANDGWVELLQLDGTLTLEDGSASSPGLAFRDDLNTGVFSSAADTFNVATGGVERMELGATTIFNEDGADVDFKIEGDTDANLFYLNAGTDRIGIGIAAPVAKLQVNGISGTNIITARAADTNGTAIIDILAEGSSGHSRILFSDTSANDGMVSYSHSDRALVFASAGTSNEGFRLDSSQRLLIGTTSTTGGSQPLQVVEDGVGGRIVLARNDTTVSAGATLGTIQAYGNDSDGSFQEVGRIDFAADKNHGTNDKAGRIVFSVTADNASSPTERIYIRNDGKLQLLGGNIELQQQNNSINTTNGQIGGGNTAQAFNSRIVFNTSSQVNRGNMTFHTMSGGTDGERMRIDYEGAIFIATTTTNPGFGTNTAAGIYFNPSGYIMSSRTNGTPAFFARNGNTGSLVSFNYNGGGQIAEITTNGSSVTYGTGSDYRLKENITTLTNAITRLKNLKPSRFNFLTTPSITQDGFIAHELQEVVPEAVTGVKDEVRTEDGDMGEKKGDPIMQNVDVARIVPLLTAAVQELITRVETLEAA